MRHETNVLLNRLLGAATLYKTTEFESNVEADCEIKMRQANLNRHAREQARKDLDMLLGADQMIAKFSKQKKYYEQAMQTAIELEKSKLKESIEQACSIVKKECDKDKDEAIQRLIVTHSQELEGLRFVVKNTANQQKIAIDSIDTAPLRGILHYFLQAVATTNQPSEILEEAFMGYNKLRAQIENQMKMQYEKLGWTYPKNANVELALNLFMLDVAKICSDLNEANNIIKRLDQVITSAYLELNFLPIVARSLDDKFFSFRNSAKKTAETEVRVAVADIDQQLGTPLDACCAGHSLKLREGSVRDRVKQFIELVDARLSEHADRDARLIGTINASAAELSLTLTPHSAKQLDTRLQEFVKQVAGAHAHLNDKAHTLEVAAAKHQALINKIVKKLDKSATDLDMAHVVVDVEAETADVEMMDATADTEMMGAADVDRTDEGRAAPNLLKTYIKKATSIIKTLKSTQETTENHLLTACQGLEIELPVPVTAEAFTMVVQDLVAQLKNDAAVQTQNLTNVIEDASSEMSIPQVRSAGLPEKLQTYIVGASGLFTAPSNQVQAVERVLNAAFADVSLQAMDKRDDQPAVRLDVFVGGVKDKLVSLENTVTEVEAQLKVYADTLNVQLDQTLPSAASITAICSDVKGKLDRRDGALKDLQDAIRKAASDLAVPTIAPSALGCLGAIVKGIQKRLSDEKLLRARIHNELSACITKGLTRFEMALINDDDTVRLLQTFFDTWITAFEDLIGDYRRCYNDSITQASSICDRVCRQLSIGVSPRAADAVQPIFLDNDADVRLWFENDSTRLIQGLRDWQAAKAGEKTEIIRVLSELAISITKEAHSHVLVIPNLAPESSLDEVRAWTEERFAAFRKLELDDSAVESQISQSQEMEVSLATGYIHDFAHKLFQVANVSLDNWPQQPGPRQPMFVTDIKKFMDGRLQALEEGLQAQRDDTQLSFDEANDAVKKIKDTAVETILGLLDNLGMERSAWVPNQSLAEYATWMSIQSSRIERANKKLQKTAKEIDLYEAFVLCANTSLLDIFQSVNVEPWTKFDGSQGPAVQMTLFKSMFAQLAPTLQDRESQLVRLQAELSGEQVQHSVATTACYDAIKDMFVAIGLGVDNWRPPQSVPAIECWLAIRCTEVSSRMQTVNSAHHAETTQLLEGLYGFVAKALQDVGVLDDKLSRPTVASQKDWVDATSKKLTDAVAARKKEHEDHFASTIDEWVGHVFEMAEISVRHLPEDGFAAIGASSSKAELALWRRSFQEWWKDEFASRLSMDAEQIQESLHETYSDIIIDLGMLDCNGMMRTMFLLVSSYNAPILYLCDSDSMNEAKENALKIKEFHMLLRKNIEGEIRNIQGLAEGLYEAVRQKKSIMAKDQKVLERAYLQMKKAIEIVNKQSTKIQALRSARRG